MHAPLQALRQAEKQFDAAQRRTSGTATQKQNLLDKWPVAVGQRKLADIINSSPRVLQQRALSDSIHNVRSMMAQPHHDHAENALPDTAVGVVQLVPSPKKKKKTAQQIFAAHKRSRTAFGYTTGTRRQGPHSLAHVAVGTAINQGISRGRDPFELLNTRAAPRTRMANALLRAELPGDANKVARHRYLKAYLKLRRKAKNEKT